MLNRPKTFILYVYIFFFLYFKHCIYQMYFFDLQYVQVLIVNQ